MSTYNEGHPFIHPQPIDWDVLSGVLINEPGFVAVIKLALPVL